MATTRHNCATCDHFDPGNRSCEGRCLHPARLPETDVWPLVRGRELPCRYDWERDLWEVKRERDAGTEGCIVGLRVWGPFHGVPALDDLPGDLLGRLVRGALDGEGAGLDLPRDLDDVCGEGDDGWAAGWRGIED